ncbi:MAG TPA: DUF4136 domain-containing protein [Steroidobacteraceae bacterium]|nr:DUF4136 domain-containing protein [Steroidobacteraceae bacterium]
MDRPAVFIPIVAATVALAGCMTVPVRTDQNTQLLATVHCQSVSWAGGFKGSSPLRNGIANPLNEARLRDAIAANLQAAGIQLVEAPPPGPPPAGSPPPPPQTPPAAQCLIGYGIGISRQVDTVYPDWGFGYGPGFWGPGWGWGPGWAWGWGAPYSYHESFITVDLYDARSRKPMWHASAEQSLSGLTGDAAAQRIRAAVDAIFRKFPK